MLRKKLILTGLAGVVCLAYYLWLTFFHLPGIPCIFYLFTGYYCPGCGITGMMLALFRLDFAEAFAANPVLLIGAPFIVYFCIRLYIAWLKGESYRMGRIERALTYLLLTALVGYGFLRNM